MVSATACASCRIQKKAVPIVLRRGAAPSVDHVGAANDGALGRLAENLRQPHHRNRPLRIKSENRLPGPTEGSWYGSPTRISRHWATAARPAAPPSGAHHHGGLVHVIASHGGGRSGFSGRTAGRTGIKLRLQQHGGWWRPPPRTAPRAAWRPGLWGAARAVSSSRASNRASTPAGRWFAGARPAGEHITCRSAADAPPPAAPARTLMC